MKWSLSSARTPGSAQVSLFMAWHHGHHQLCSDTITNFLSAAARSKVASDQSLQKPSLPRSAAWTGDETAEAPRRSAARTPKNRIMDFSCRRIARPCLQPGPFGGPITPRHAPYTGSGGTMTVTVQPTTPDFAAEVGDVDLGKPLGAEDLAAIRAAFTKYAVLVFPDQNFTDDSQLDFARNFGPLETSVFALRRDHKLRLNPN